MVVTNRDVKGRSQGRRANTIFRGQNCVPVRKEMHIDLFLSIQITSKVFNFNYPPNKLPPPFENNGQLSFSSGLKKHRSTRLQSGFSHGSWRRFASGRGFRPLDALHPPSRRTRSSHASILSLNLSQLSARSRLHSLAYCAHVEPAVLLCAHNTHTRSSCCYHR